MTTMRRTIALLFVATLAACGGGGSSSGPTAVPSPSIAPGATVVAIVYYDENGNGRADPEETIRVPDVEVDIGGRSGHSEEATGHTVITNVPSGAQTFTVRASTLPPFYAAEAPVTVQVPLADGTPTMIGLTLPIGGNETNTYMAFGDSITDGDGSTNGGYPPDLEARLAAHFGGAVVNKRGADSTNSFEGVERVKRNLAAHPAYTLVLYGANDWNAPECQDNPHCATTDNLRLIVEAVKAANSLPFLSTIPPADPTMNPASRNQWVSDVNNLVRPMAASEGAFLVDVEKAFLSQGDISKLFSDHIHPNDAGYAIIAQTFFEAIAHGKSTPTSSASFFFRAPR